MASLNQIQDIWAKALGQYEKGEKKEMCLEKQRGWEREREWPLFLPAFQFLSQPKLYFPPCVLGDTPYSPLPLPNKSHLSPGLAWVVLCSFQPKDHWLNKQCQYFLQSESIRTGKSHCTINKALLYSAVVMRTVGLAIPSSRSGL